MININNSAAQRVFDFFEEISAIPRTSGNTSQIADHLVSFAKTKGLEYVRDEYDNVIIRKNATQGYEDRETIIIQGHSDMVAAVEDGREIDMTKVGVKILEDGDFLTADGTTLGADNGIFVSFAIGAFFSITYTVPAQLAAEENETGTVCASTMYFAVQGLFEAISASLATQVILIAIRMIGGGSKDAAGNITDGSLMSFFPLFVAGFCMLAFLMTYLLPRSISRLGKINKSEEDLQPDDIKAEATVNE